MHTLFENVAQHIAEGLGMQILERQDDANAFWPHGDSAAITEAERVCKNWDNWHGDPKNWWHPFGTFQDDSGV